MAESNLRLTPMGVKILALLCEDDMHPYEMVRLMRARRCERLFTVTNGTLYHTVTRLEQAGLTTEVGTDRDGNRPERTTYSLTDAGRDALLDWVSRTVSSTERSVDFRVALSEVHRLERSVALACLRDQRAALANRQALLTEELQDAREQSVPEQVLLEFERNVVLIEAEQRWLDSVLTRLGEGAIPWGSGALEESEHYLIQRKTARQ